MQYEPLTRRRSSSAIGEAEPTAAAALDVHEIPVQSPQTSPRQNPQAATAQKTRSNPGRAWREWGHLVPESSASVAPPAEQVAPVVPAPGSESATSAVAAPKKRSFLSRVGGFFSGIGRSIRKFFGRLSEDDVLWFFLESDPAKADETMKSQVKSYIDRLGVFSYLGLCRKLKFRNCSPSKLMPYFSKYALTKAGYDIEETNKLKANIQPPDTKAPTHDDSAAVTNPDVGDTHTLKVTTPQAVAAQIAESSSQAAVAQDRQQPATLKPQVVESGPQGIPPQVQQQVTPFIPQITSQIPQTASVVHLPDTVPAPEELTYSQICNLGNESLYLFTDYSGRLWLFKPAIKQEEFRAYVQEAAYKVQQIVSPGFAIPVGVGELATPTKKDTQRRFGAYQYFVPGTRQLKNEDLDTLNADQIQRLLGEHVTDWLLANFDTKAANFIVSPNGDIFGIDKEEAFIIVHAGRIFGFDNEEVFYIPDCPEMQQMSLEYYVSNYPIYNYLFTRIRDRKIPEPEKILSILEIYIKRVEAFPDEQYREIFRQYIEALYSGSDPESVRKKDAFLDKMVLRKRNLRQTYREFIRNQLGLNPDRILSLGSDCTREVSPH